MWTTLAAIVAVFVLIGVISDAAGSGSTNNTADTTPVTSVSSPAAGDSSAPVSTAPASPITRSEQPPKPKSRYTLSEQQAIGSAEDYLSAESGFSKAGLIAQLDSNFGAGFSKKDATFAVNHIKVNWNQQAVDSAKSYLQTEHFSRDGLISQLDSSFGGQFTEAQATYAVNKVGL